MKKLIPNHGPIRGGSEVLVLGAGFIPSSLLSCQFGQNTFGQQVVVPAAHVLNSSAIICLSPPNLFAQSVSVQVSNNGVFDSNTPQSGVTFTYDQVIRISQLIPPMGPVSGNITVRVIGGPFVPTSELRCKFGSIEVQAFFQGDGEVLCYAPPHPPGVYPLEVTLNDQDYSSSRRPFFYYRDPALSRINPVSGPARAAGTLVSVYGSGFVNSSLLTCRFGGTSVFGRFVSSNYVICPAPVLNEAASGGMHYEALSEVFNAYPDPVNYLLGLTGGNRNKLFPSAYFYPLYLSRLVTVEISNNNQDFTFSGISYLYQQDAVVDSVLPNTGQVNQRIPIAVKGNNFVNSSTLRCRIGEYISVPTFLAPNLVLCFTPETPLISYSQGYVRDRQTQSTDRPEARQTDTSPFPLVSNIVYVEVSNNAQDYTNNKVTFTFNVKCLPGYYCPQLNQLPCPLGTFCPGEFNSNYTLCPAGTYNPLLAQADCFRCPIGFICPEEGMHVPRICPPGFVCEVTGSLIADNPCPVGHFCLEGTATSATTCGHPDLSSELFPIMSHGERPSTLRKNRIAQGQQLFLGARNSGSTF